MNEKINLCEILKDVQEGTKLYSPLVGVVELKNIYYYAEYPIDVVYNNGRDILSFTKDGLYFLDATDGECMLWPSKEVRTWEGFKVNKPKFDPTTLHPFDRVLCKNGLDIWRCDFFSSYMETYACKNVCIGGSYLCCIPYNDDTKHLVGTSNEAPGFYRYWEE